MSITRVQYVSAASGGSGATSLTATFAAASAGNLLVAHAVVGSTASNGTSSTPSGWTLGAGPITNTSGAVSNINEYLWWKIATGGETSVVATDTVSSGITLQVWEFASSTGWPSNPLDVLATNPNQAATTTPSTGTTASTAQAEELWIAGCSTNSGTQISYSAPTNGFTLETMAWAGATAFFSPNSAALYRIASATGTASAGVTSSISRPFAGLVAAFKNNPPVAGAGQLVANSALIEQPGAQITNPVAPMPSNSALIETGAQITLSRVLMAANSVVLVIEKPSGKHLTGSTTVRILGQRAELRGVTVVRPTGTGADLDGSTGVRARLAGVTVER